MIINENMEFEALNRKVKERTANEDKLLQSVEDCYRRVCAKKKARSVICIMIVAAVLTVAVTGFWALEEIAWINHSFRIVLTVLSGAAAMFCAGYLWCKGRK